MTCVRSFTCSLVPCVFQQNGALDWLIFFLAIRFSDTLVKAPALSQPKFLCILAVSPACLNRGGFNANISLRTLSHSFSFSRLPLPQNTLLVQSETLFFPPLKTALKSSHCSSTGKEPDILSRRMQVQFLVLLSWLRIWHCPKLQCRSEMWLGSGVAVV